LLLPPLLSFPALPLTLGRYLAMFCGSRKELLSSRMEKERINSLGV
jgi:hypothetical protein